MMGMNRGDDMIEQKTLEDASEKKEVSAVKHRPLTEKERAYVEYRIRNPRATKKEAMKATADVRRDLSDKTYNNMATAIEKRPAVLAVLTEHAEKSERMLVQLAEAVTEYAMTGTKEGAMYASTAERVLNSMLDRVHGKAKQSIDIQSTAVNINIDLSK